MADASRTVKVKLVAGVRSYVQDIATATAATKLLREEAERFDGRKYRAKLDVDTTSALAKLRGLESAMGTVKSKQVGVSTRGNLRQQTGEIRALGSAIAALGPAGVAAGGVASAALMGLSGSFGVVAAAAGTGIAAFQGVGDALSALREYDLDPSAANAEKLRAAMAELTREGQNLARFLDSDLRPAMRELRNTAQSNMLPGVQRGLAEMMTILPQVRSLVAETADTLGDLAEESGRSFNTTGAREYIGYLESRARPTLDALVRSTLDVGRGVAGMLRGFDVALGDDVLRTVQSMSAEFAKWGSGLRMSTGLQEFGDYVREVGPQVSQTIGAISDALLAVMKAAAPMSGPVLAAIRGLASAVEAIAESEAGPAIFGVAAALGAVNLALKMQQGIANSPVLGLLGGIADRGTKAGGAVGKLAGALRYLGPSAVVGVAALAGIGWAYDQIKSKATESAEAVARGTMTTTQAYDEELRRLRSRKQVMADMTEGYAMGEAIGELTGKIDRNAVALAEEAEAWRLTQEGRKAYLAELPFVERATAAAAFAQADYTHAVEKFGVNSGPAAVALRAMNDANKAADLQQRAAAAGTDVHTASVTRQRDLMLGAIDTTLGWHAALQRATETVKTNGAATDLNTASGLANRQALQDLTRAALADIEAKGRQGVSTQEITRLTMSHRDQLIDTAIRMGMSRKAAEEYADQLGLTPAQVTTQFNTPGLDAAKSGVKELNDLIGGLRKDASFNIGKANLPNNIGMIPGRATGGPVYGPGTSTSDSILTRLSDGEWVMRARAVREQGHGAMAMLNAGKADVVPRRATGGPVNGSVTYDFRDYAASIKATKERWFPPMPEMPMGGGGVGGGSARWAGVALQALAMLGQPASLLPRVLKQIDIESSGNPRAINLWDINARRGTPSMGLIQTIMPTYLANADPRRNLGPYDPLSNLLAGMRYAIRRYGSIAAIWPKTWGYASGGVIPGAITGRDDKLALAQAGERVLTRRQTAAFDGLVSHLDKPTPASPASLSGGGASAEALRPIIHQEITATFAETIDLDLFNQRQDFMVRSVSGFGG